MALITVPIVFALLGGFGTGINEMMLDGIKKIAPTGVMLMFAILYFGVMIDAVCSTRWSAASCAWSRAIR